MANIQSAHGNCLHLEKYIRFDLRSGQHVQVHMHDCLVYPLRYQQLTVSFGLYSHAMTAVRVPVKQIVYLGVSVAFLMEYHSVWVEWHEDHLAQSHAPSRWRVHSFGSPVRVWLRYSYWHFRFLVQFVCSTGPRIDDLSQGLGH